MSSMVRELKAGVFGSLDLSDIGIMILGAMYAGVLVILIVQGRSENSHNFGLFNIILSQESPEIISIIRDPSQLSMILTKPSRIRFFLQNDFFWSSFGQ